ncbi:EAL domain-containing protein [Sporomusa malonica]|uniref:EAL domain-containing protein n=1 Tax=Sporomusa malonica TaxID=112901 RepID=UPI0015931390|nr:EAL domain-containing protein [Sporomusa malonica]
MNTFTNDMYEIRKTELQHIVSLAQNAIKPILARKHLGEISLGDARLQAAEIINRFIYFDEMGPNYVFLASYEGYTLVNPLEPDTVGTYEMQRQDLDGLMITKELLQTAKSGGGFVLYYESRTPGEIPQKKLSFVIGLPEIECYLGTGMYVGDIDRTYNALLEKLLFSGIIILVIIGFLQYYFMRPLLYGFNTLLRAFGDFRANPKSQPIISRQSYANGTEADVLINSFLELTNELLIHRKNIEKSEEKFRLAAQSANDVIWDWDADKRETSWSDKMRDILGHYPDGKNAHFEIIEDWIHADDRQRRRLALLEHFTEKSEFYLCEYRIIIPFTSERRWLLAKGKSVQNSEGVLVRIVGTLTDITEPKLRDEQIYHLAYYDSLTNLPNRSYLTERLSAELEASAMGDVAGALMFLDLNEFKRVNDLFGHSRGDQLLVHVANRLGSVLGDRGLLLRLGGDEFVILAPNLSGAAAEALAQEIVNESTYPYSYQDETFFVSVSIGIALYPEDGCDPDTLLVKADTAMYHVKESPSKGYSRFHPSMQEVALKKIRLENLLSKAIDRNELEVYYQPQIDLVSNRPVSIEALLRWQRPGKGHTQPADFIPIAEESGLIIPIGAWVLIQACNFCRHLHSLGLEDIYVTVNISTKQVEQPNFIRTVEDILAETGLHPHQLELEITESLFMNSFDACIQKFNQLKAMGLRLALDDFGTGYSSLTYLRHLPIDTLKMDKDFLQELHTENFSIVEAIIRLAHILNIKVVAEGVEVPEHVSFLCNVLCDRAQGYLFCKPVSEQEVIDFLSQFQRVAASTSK